MWRVSAWPVGGNLPFQLRPGEFTIGRAKEHAIVIYDSSISRTHARLFVGPRGDMTIEDLGSRNGIDVNGKLTQFGGLRLNDRIRLGAVPCLLTPEPVLRSFSLDEESTVAHVRPDEAQHLRVDAGLSPPQREVLRLIAAGLSEDEAAGRTGRSVHTVHNHLRAIYKALGVHSRTELFARLGQGIPAGPDSATDLSPPPKE